MKLFHKNGFTLIELMITVAIIGLIAGIAYPSYAEYVKRSHRADVRTLLLENAQFLERNYTTANRYDQTSGGATINTAALPKTQSPASGVARYTITLATGTAPAQTFTLSAIPSGSMSGDSCGTLTLTNTGARGSSGNVAACWETK